MNSNNAIKPCSGNCGACHAAASQADQCDIDSEGLKGWVAAGHRADALDGMSGWPMVYRTALAFLLPPVTALTGAFVAGQTQLARFCGMALGFIAGIAIAWAVCKTIDHVTKNKLN